MLAPVLARGRAAVWRGVAPPPMLNMFPLIGAAGGGTGTPTLAPAVKFIKGFGEAFKEKLNPPAEGVAKLAAGAGAPPKLKTGAALDVGGAALALPKLKRGADGVELAMLLLFVFAGTPMPPAGFF